jgi:hypothetical protein
VNLLDNSTFSTERLQLAIYLHASQRLLFLGCKAGQNNKIRFVFEDPDSSGPQVELEFDRGAEVAASDLFASQKYLRRKMSEEINRRNGKTT